VFTTARRTTKIFAALAAVPAGLLLAGTSAAASPVAAGHVTSPHYRVRQILNGLHLRHTFIPAGSTTKRSEPLADPDDITVLGHRLYTAFQNGVGPQGQPSTDGNTFSTVVEFTGSGRVIRQWDLKGKCDGLTADPGRQLLIATVNEDANSSIYTITPGAPAAAQTRHYRYNKPLPQSRPGMTPG
jgi:hypothetical protein